MQQTTLSTNNYQQCQLAIRFGDEILEAGFTAVPNLFLQHYHSLGLSDPEAIWIIHLLRFKWTADAPWPHQSKLPMSTSDKTRRRYASHLRKLGLLFTRRIYHTEETAPAPDLIGKMKSLEYHFDSLFHNIVRVHAHLAAGHDLADFAVELPFDVVKKVATGWFQDVPRAIKAACQKHLAGGALGQPLLLPQNGIVDQNACSTTTPKTTSSFSGSSFSGSSFWGRQEEDSLLEKDTEEKEEEEAGRKTHVPAAAPVHSDIYRLLSNFGIHEPALTELSSNGLAPETVRGWILYLETQNFDRKAGYLVKRLRERSAPPAPFDALARLTNDQIAVLQRQAGTRRWTSYWDDDALSDAGIDEEAAELWYQHLGRNRK